MADARSEVVRVRLPGQPSSVSAARHLVCSRANGFLCGEELDTAELLVSEVVTNAVVHAGTCVELVVSLLGGTTLLVEVTDGSAQRPATRHYAVTAGTGRGLHLLDELADRWGVAAGPTGKTVWFQLSVGGVDGGAGAPRESVAEDGSPAGVVVVELLNVPLRLHARWREQAEALLRDYLLASLDDGDADASIQAHARCSDAIALLAEHVPAPVARSGDVHGADADGDEVWCPRARLPVPHDAVAHFAALDETLDLALELAGTDRLLSAATGTAEQDLRRWMCRQVAEQARGGPPVPWPGDGG